MSAVPLRAEPPRDRYSYDHLRLDPVTPTIGAEIAGIDLRRPVSPGQAADIRRALNEWRVVFFRDQDIDPDQLKAFGRSFGPLTPAHPIAAGLPDHPEVWERRVDEYRARRQRNDTLPPGREPPRDHKGWHIDITFVANPNSYSLLHGLTIPPYGGDTLFTNLIAAYEGLSAPIRTLVDGLQAVHRTSGGDFAGAKPEARGQAYVSLHPLVRVHPETGERLLFLNPGTISHIVGLNARESEALLDLLFYEATRPEYQVRFRWQPQSLVVWDNQAVAHAGPIDYAQFDLPRAVRRITVAGDLPTGPDGFRSRPLEGELFPVLG